MSNLKIKTTDYHSIKKFGQVHPRARPNLDKIVMVFLNSNAHSPTRTIQATEIAEHSSIDRSQVMRLIAGRPGFVKVITIKNGLRSVGYYINTEFVTGDAHYIDNTVSLANKKLWPSEQVLTMEDETPIRENSLPQIRYQGQAHIAQRYEVDAFELDEARLKTILRENEKIFSQAAKAFNHAIEAVKMGQSVPLEEIERAIIIQVAFYHWLVGTVGRPESALEVFNIMEEK